MMIEWMGKARGGGKVWEGEGKYGSGSLVVVVVMLRPDHHPLPSPTAAAATKPHVVVCCRYVVMCCDPHLSSPCCCVSLHLRVVVVGARCVWYVVAALLRAALALVVRCALLLRCVRSLSLALGGGRGLS
jgi:hypothetical protein